MSLPNLVRSDPSLLKRYEMHGGAVTRFLTPDTLVAFLVLAAGYFLAAKIAQQFALPNSNVAEFWLPAGISLAAVLLRGNRVWPAIFVGAFLVNMTCIRPLSICIGIAAASALEALIAGYLVNKFAHGASAFHQSGDVLRFAFFAGVLAPALCATVGASVLCQGGMASWTDFWQLWPVWWVGDMLGALLVTPFLVLLLGHKHHFLSVAELLEAAAILMGLSIVCVLNFGPPLVSWMPGSGFLFLCAPFLAWAALRFCPLEAAGAVFVMGGFALWGSLHGFGPFGSAADLPRYVVGFMAVGSVTTMATAAAFAQQKKNLEDVMAMYYLLMERQEREANVQKDAA